MGFYEDDRILSKNRLHNKAYKLITDLRISGLSNDEIINNVDTLIQLNQSEIRNDLRNIILKTIRGFDESSNS